MFKNALPQPFAQEHAVDPYPAYRALLDDGNLQRITVRPGLDAWLVLGHDLARQALNHPAISLEARHAQPPVREAIMAGYMEEKQSFFGQHLLATDGERHRHMRRVMSRALTARRFHSMAPEVEGIVNALIDELPAPGHTDLAATLVVPFTISVLARLMGLPEPARGMLTELANAVIQGKAEDDAGFTHVISELTTCFSELLDHPERIAPDGLLTMLVEARSEETITPRRRSRWPTSCSLPGTRAAAT